MMMMTTEKIMGEPTSLAAFTINPNLLLPLFLLSERCRKIFSTITIDASPSIPIAMAIPPNDIRFADNPENPIHITAKSAHKGKDNATIKAVRRLPRNKSKTSSTKIPPISNDFFTVPVAFATR